MALAHTAEAAKHVVISVTINIPEVDPLASFDDELRDWIIELNVFLVQVQVVTGLGGGSEGSLRNSAGSGGFGKLKRFLRNFGKHFGSINGKME